jgi:hypothetical protein
MIDNYKKLCTRFYDIDHPSPPPEEFAVYYDALSEVHGPILEPMCGSGRFLVPLLKHGCDLDQKSPCMYIPNYGSRWGMSYRGVRKAE